jgi:hypothetical protein
MIQTATATYTGAPRTCDVIGNRARELFWFWSANKQLPARSALPNLNLKFLKAGAVGQWTVTVAAALY